MVRAKDALGRYGEDVAARHLIEQGIVVLERNWRCDAGEIDIVGRDGDCAGDLRSQDASNDRLRDTAGGRDRGEGGPAATAGRRVGWPRAAYDRRTCASTSSACWRPGTAQRGSITSAGCCRDAGAHPLGGCRRRGGPSGRGRGRPRPRAAGSDAGRSAGRGVVASPATGSAPPSSTAASRGPSTGSPSTCPRRRCPSRAAGSTWRWPSACSRRPSGCLPSRSPTSCWSVSSAWTAWSVPSAACSRRCWPRPLPGACKVVVPVGNAAEAAVVPGASVFAVATLSELVAVLRGDSAGTAVPRPDLEVGSAALPDLVDVAGQRERPVRARGRGRRRPPPAPARPARSRQDHAGRAVAGPAAAADPGPVAGGDRDPLGGR